MSELKIYPKEQITTDQLVRALALKLAVDASAQKDAHIEVTMMRAQRFTQFINGKG